MDSYSQQYEDEMWDAASAAFTRKTTPLRAYPGWEVREYATGMFDAASTSGALSPGFDSFQEAVAWVRTQA